MPLNNSYDEQAVIQAIASALETFYGTLIEKIDGLNIQKVMKRKNPYLYRAKAMQSATEIVDSVLTAFVSSSEETIFGNCFFEPIAIAATNEVLPQIDQFEEKMNLVWLDYDGAFSEGMLSDIETLCRRLYVGSMFFISCNYSFAGKASEKRSAFEKSVGDYFEPDIEKSRYTNNGIPLIIQELINNLILKVLEKRNRSDSSRNVQYMQLLFLKYKDGAPMLTIGGILVDDELKDRIINSNILQKLIYCSRDNECFNIEVPKLTYKEIQLVLREIPITDKEYEENKERFHGIGLDEIRKFEKIYRYYPYYTEGCLNT